MLLFIVYLFLFVIIYCLFVIIYCLFVFIYCLFVFICYYLLFICYYLLFICFYLLLFIVYLGDSIGRKIFQTSKSSTNLPFIPRLKWGRLLRWSLALTVMLELCVDSTSSLLGRSVSLHRRQMLSRQDVTRTLATAPLIQNAKERTEFRLVLGRLTD